jgi:adenylosuccinate synthase
MTSLPREMTSLQMEIASEALVIRSVTNLTMLEADVCDKMAQIMVLQADLTTAETPRTPR